MPNPVIYSRFDPTVSDEITIAGKHFDVYPLRTQVPKNSLVIARYSCLPFYKELEDDFLENNSSIINSYAQHKWIADFQYYKILKEFTFPSYSWNDLPSLPNDTKLVVKGKTNSLKQRWNTHMFADSVSKAQQIALELQYDALIGQQDIIFRKYIPLETFEVGVNGLPFTNEWRFFFYKNKLLSYGYYWSNALNILTKCPDECIAFAQNIANIAQNHTNFFVLDVAKTQSNDWILVEVNDGQMSGLSENNPDILYLNLKKYLTT